MRKVTTVEEKPCAGARTGALERRPAVRPQGSSIRWVPIVVNSLFLLTVIAVPNIGPDEDTAPIVLRRMATCAPIGPIASQYVDKKKVCRRARQEVLHSLKTGRDPDWDDVARDSIPRATKRPRRHSPSKHHHHKATEHRTKPTPTRTPSTKLTPAGPKASAKGGPAASTESPAPAPAGTGQLIPRSSKRVPISPTEPESRRPGWLGWAAAAVLFALVGGVIHAARRCRTGQAALHHIKRSATSSTQATPTALPQLTPSTASLLTLSATASMSLTGPGAEDAVRRLAVDVLVGQQGEAFELVLTRPDARRLFGIDVDTLRDYRVPGLTLTDDTQQTRAHLAGQGSARRIFITCDGDAEAVRTIRAQHPDRTTVVSLSGSHETSIEISADGQVTPDAAAPPVPGRLTLLARLEALALLGSMPTVAMRTADEQVVRDLR